MSALITLKVCKIRIQKDEYETAAGNIGETAFWKSNDNQADVLQFKRAIATCILEGQDFSVNVELIVSLRAGYVRVRVLGGGAHTAEAVTLLLQNIFAQLHHTPGYASAGALQPLYSRNPGRYMLCKTYDSQWFIATLHEVKDEKEMCFEVDVETLGKFLSPAVPALDVFQFMPTL